VYRPEKSGSNETRFFRQQPQAIAPMRVAFIGTDATASASEFVINAQIPYLAQSMALVGANTFGKPVGQIAIDRSACDDRLRVVAFSTKNAANSDDYFNGLAATVPNSCQATDDVSFPLGDPREASVARALDFVAGRTCTPIAVGQRGQALGARRELLRAERPNAAQREVPGLF
jgi:carboxyl-terminal processing protease